MRLPSIYRRQKDLKKKLTIRNLVHHGCNSEAAYGY